ncbi:DUF362 domain-containing protein [Tepidibacter thalassicus]|uniref:Uncharacterized conserved protein, DUF362 family n=1 Tax=Tepidibacter thalassicus DSM 15285 TaxID=1123350 RepID=A0A1M5QFV5_9FIRM|nr:DUF362 domain-containing protein [Tepidibacter thalassicus]SHH13075.1 Uncharacterized conserved protein, DUF362 family [Tepidibacter thalassicus DSM 15285]
MRTNRKIAKPIIAITQAQNEIDSLKNALDLLPMNEIIKSNDVVVITPNWVKSKYPSTATVVGPNTLQALIKYIKTKNPSKIYIATGSGGNQTPDVMKYVGYDKIIEAENVEFIDLNYGPYTTIELDHNIIPNTKINKLIDEVDVLISFTQLKHHEEATMSAGIKNIALAWPPGEIHGFPKKNLGIHEDLHGFIVAMAKKIPIDLTIISADKAMIGSGPSDGKSINVKGLIIAGTDPVACDTIGARMLGFLPQAVQYLYRAYNEGIGEAKPENMQIKGMLLEEAEKIFSKTAYGTEIVIDKEKIKDIHGNK